MAKNVTQLFRLTCKNDPSYDDGLTTRLSELASSASRKTYLESYSKHIALAKGCYSAMLLNAVKNLNLPYNKNGSWDNGSCKEAEFGVLETKLVNINRITLVYIIKELIKMGAMTKTIDNLILNDVAKTLECCSNVDYSKYYALLHSVKSDDADVYVQPVEVKVSNKFDNFSLQTPNNEFLAMCTSLGYSKLVDMLITLSSVKVAYHAKR